MTEFHSNRTDPLLMLFAVTTVLFLLWLDKISAAKKGQLEWLTAHWNVALKTCIVKCHSILDTNLQG